jgi:outer membrane cobalamin receptor
MNQDTWHAAFWLRRQTIFFGAAAEVFTYSGAKSSRRNSFFRIGFSLLVVACWTHEGWAGGTRSSQETPGQLKKLSLAQLGDLEVTSVSKDPRQVQKTPAAIFVITQEDIRRSAATSIPEALRSAPGVEVARVDANHWSVAIRGLAGQFSKDLLVLIDGRSVYTPLFAGVYWDTQALMLEDVERIEVIRGPGGTIWGANAVNGVINIITKSAENTQGALATLGGRQCGRGDGRRPLRRDGGEGFQLSCVRHRRSSRAGISLRRGSIRPLAHGTDGIPY